jgi:hypothetical protein
MTLLLLLFSLPAGRVMAQCNCSQPDPKGYSSTSCGLSEPNLTGSATVCSLASSCSSGTDYLYTFNFPTNVTGYFWKITGGYGYRELIYINSSSTIDRNNCGTNTCGAVSGYQCREYGNPNAVYQLAIYVRWTSAGPGNKIELWGYTGISGGYPATLTYYKCYPITVSSPPSTPTYISISSPTYSPCGWKVASSYVSNATSYSWGGAGYGTYPDITGPGIPGNQTAYICVSASNACGTSPYYCAYVNIPRNSSCQRVAGRDADTLKNDVGPGEPAALAESRSEAFSVSPNPARNNLHINFGKPGKRDVVLVSALGHIDRRISAIESQQLDIDVTKLPPGVYLVLIYQNQRVVAQQKVIVEK